VTRAVFRKIHVCDMMSRFGGSLAGVMTASETAQTAAAARAAHLIVDRAPLIFADPLAYPLLGERAEELVAYHRNHGDHPVLAGARAAVTTRSRYTEDRLAALGVDQYVILGAGLDSYAYRSAGPVRVFEVDHPATQEWKRHRLAGAGIAVPPSVTFVPVDFEADSWLEGLCRNGFDPGRPALVGWLGVTMYLTREAIGRTLAELGRCAPGTEVVLDYLLPAELRDPAGRTYADLVAPVAAQRGEPWLSFFAPDAMAALLAGHGLTTVAQVPQRDCVGAALWQRTDALRPSTLAVLAHATLER
jgi:methyltransferase (TIGR00027 family)